MLRMMRAHLIAKVFGRSGYKTRLRCLKARRSHAYRVGIRRVWVSDCMMVSVCGMMDI